MAIYIHAIIILVYPILFSFTGFIDHNFNVIRKCIHRVFQVREDSLNQKELQKLDSELSTSFQPPSVDA